MTQEDKQLLFKDLCGRLPYGIKVQYDSQTCKLVTTNDDYTVLLLGEDGYVPNIEDGLFLDIEKVKPYLRPMSSMTEEEMDEVEMIMGVEDNKSIIFDFTSDGNIIFKNGNCSVCVFKKLIDYLYSCHFDFNNLIEKGLAIEAPEGMYLY